MCFSAVAMYAAHCTLPPIHSDNHPDKDWQYLHLHDNTVVRSQDSMNTFKATVFCYNTNSILLQHLFCYMMILYFPQRTNHLMMCYMLLNLLKII